MDGSARLAVSGFLVELTGSSEVRSGREHAQQKST